MKQTILFADNDRRIRQYCKQELQDQGFRVVLAEDGDDALAIMDTIAIDLVILDEHMPRCAGLDAAKLVRQRYPSVPIILFTADQRYEGGQSPHVDACIIKSEDLAALKATIARLLDEARGTPPRSGASQRANFGSHSAC